MAKNKRKKLTNSEKRAQDKKHLYQSPRNHLNRLTRKSPQIWDNLDKIRKADALIPWDSNCFVPTEIVGEILGCLTPIAQIEPDLHLEEQYTALAAWRYTQGVYNFEPVLVQELIDTPISGDIPTEVIERLPEWCVYLPVNNEKLNQLTGKQLKGFFAYLEHRSSYGEKFLALQLDFGTELIPYYVMLGDWDLNTGIAKAYKHLSGQSGQLADERNIELGKVIPALVSALMSLTLYLCTEEPDIERVEPEITASQRHQKQRSMMKLQPPSRPKVWPVGKKISKQLKSASKSNTGYQTGKQKKPHIRRAHWHGAWRGKRGSSDRQFVMNWWAPIVINSNL